MHPHAGTWQVAAIIDWEHAFSAAYQAAVGTLPEGWRMLARVADLADLCGVLAHEHADEESAREVAEMVKAAAEDRDPS